MEPCVLSEKQQLKNVASVLLNLADDAEHPDYREMIGDMVPGLVRMIERVIADEQAPRTAPRDDRPGGKD